MRVALLARVSTEDQADGHSMPAQLAAMRARCEREGWSVVRVFEAAGESAFTGELARRPVLLEAVRAAEAGEFELLMVHESSRFARKAKLHHEVMDRLERAGVRVVDVVTPLLPRTAETFVADGMNAVLNEYWSRKMSEHIRKGLARRFELGLPVGDVPFGYRVEEPGGVPLVVEDEARAIRWMFEERASGLGYDALARRLNELGLRPRSKQGRTSFTGSAVQSLLENDFYAGFIRHKGARKMGAHEPVISEDAWLKAQAMVKRQRAPRSRHVRMLAGLLECVHCGAPVNVAWGGAKGRELRYYREGKAGQCERPRRMRAELAEGKVDALVASMLADRAWVVSLDRKSRVKPRDTGERAVLIEERKRAVSAWIEGRLEEADYREIVEGIESRLARLPAGAPGELVFAGKRFTEWGEVWGVLSEERKAQALRILWERVYVDLEEQEVYFRPREWCEELFRERRRWVLGTPARGRGSLAPNRFPWLFKCSEMAS